MSELTARMSFPFPSEGERPFFNIFKQFADSIDAASFAHSENKNLLFIGGGDFTFNAGTDTLSWDAEIKIVAFVSGFAATIAAGSTTIEDGDVVFFAMPRRLKSNRSVSVSAVTKLSDDSTTPADQVVLAARFGSEVFFLNGNSIIDGQTKQIFGGGFGGGSGHTHTLEKFVAAGGETSFNLSTTSPALQDIRWYRNGNFQFPGDDYSLDTGTGEVTLIGHTADANDKYVADKRIVI